MNILCKYLRFFVLLVVLMLAGCYSIPPAKVYNEEKLREAKTAYIVDNPKVIGSFQILISEVLQERGLKTQIGLIENKPKDVDIYVEYIAYHSWDMARYLKEYTISIFDNKTNLLLASDSFSTGFFHDFANSRKVTNMLINNIFGPLSVKVDHE